MCVSDFMLTSICNPMQLLIQLHPSAVLLCVAFRTAKCVKRSPTCASLSSASFVCNTVRTAWPICPLAPCWKCVRRS